MGRASYERGGNAMGLGPTDRDRIILELQCSWAGAQDDDTLHGLARQMTDWLDVEVPHWNVADRTPYLPLFMNDAMWDQNVTQSYENHRKYRLLQQALDPKGLFRERTGGFKY